MITVVNDGDVKDAVKVIRKLGSTNFPLSLPDITAISELETISLDKASLPQLTAFQQSYNHLAVQMQPVLARDLLSENQTINSRKAQFFQCVSILLLLLVVGTTFQWLSGSEYLKQTSNLETKFTSFPDEIKGAAIKAIFNRDPSQTAQIPQPSLAIVPDLINLMCAKEQLIKWNSSNWNIIPRNISQAITPTKSIDNLPPQFKEYGKEVLANFINPQIASHSLQALSFLILPFLYGMLGGCIFTLRRINNQIEIYGYVVSFSVKKVLFRVFLGGILGFTIGLINSKEEGPSGSPTAFALALAAGFSMDMFFSFLESFKPVSK